MGFHPSWAEALERRGLIAPKPEPPPALDILEEPFQAKVIALAKRNGLICYHTRDSRRSEPGYPDCAFAAIAPPWRYFLAEMKREAEEPKPSQWVWINSIRAAGIDCYVWHPSDWVEIVATMEGSK